MDQDRTKDWREICKAAASELNPAKLMDLIAELTRALDERDQRRQATPREKPETNNRGARPLQHEVTV